MRTDPARPTSDRLFASLPRDATAGLVVFLVALPLCLGVAMASGAPLFAGVLAGIVGGILVGSLSGSHTSVSGPAAGLTAIVAAQIASLGSFSTFLVAVVLAGLIQIGLGIFRFGFIAAFFPSSVIKGLLAAIGTILILKQIPHVFGHHSDPEGEMAFRQPDQENTLSELAQVLGHVHPGAATIGILSIALLVVWEAWKPLKKSPIPAQLIVVLLGVGMSQFFQHFGADWSMGASQLVQVPVAESFAGFVGFIQLPDFSQWSSPAVYTAGLTIAAVASLETLLNLEAIDKIDPQQRRSGANRELVAQGIGNVAAGLVGGLPITSVIVRSSVNINAGARTKLAAIIHGALLLVCVSLLPAWLNLIPLSCLAAILLVTGAKLVSPALIKQMWGEGPYQFIPFAVTLVAIVFTDLLIGIGIGLTVSLAFILNSSMWQPVRRIEERHLSGNVLHIELANQISFLNRAALSTVLDEVQRGGQVLLNAESTDYIDPDVLALIRDFREKTAPARGVKVSLLGFREKYQLRDEVQYVDYSTRELQSALSPEQVLLILREGHDRFRTGRRLTRDLARQATAMAQGQHPLAVVLSCIDSRTPAELIFDLGVGDIFSVRIAGNVTSRKVLASVEYGCAVAGAKLILVLGHTSCGAVKAAVDLMNETRDIAEVTGCQHLSHIVTQIQQSTDPLATHAVEQMSVSEKQSFIDAVAYRNVARVVQSMRQQSETLDRLAQEGRVAIRGAMYDITTGDIEFLPNVAEVESLSRQN